MQYSGIYVGVNKYVTMKVENGIFSNKILIKYWISVIGINFLEDKLLSISLYSPHNTLMYVCHFKKNVMEYMSVLMNVYTNESCQWNILEQNFN